MTLDSLLQAIVIAVTALGALGVVVSASIIRSAVWLLVTLIGVSFVYFLLGAEFLGATQFIVYIGGTMVLIVFGVMMTAGGPFATLRIPTHERILAGLIVVPLFAALVGMILKLSDRETPQPLPGVGEMGLAFLGSAEPASQYLLPFEILSVHLLVVLIAAAYLARAKKAAVPS